VVTHHTAPARLAGGGYPRVGDRSAGDELRFANDDDEHLIGVGTSVPRPTVLFRFTV
jgi:hypothetical protein